MSDALLSSTVVFRARAKELGMAEAGVDENNKNLEIGEPHEAGHVETWAAAVPALLITSNFKSARLIYFRRF